MSSFLQNVQERVVIYDGAMGTNIQVRQPSPDDFWGKEGCNEILVLSRPMKAHTNSQTRLSAQHDD